MGYHVLYGGTALPVLDERGAESHAAQDSGEEEVLDSHGVYARGVSLGRDGDSRAR